MDYGLKLLNASLACTFPHTYIRNETREAPSLPGAPSLFIQTLKIELVFKALSELGSPCYNNVIIPKGIQCGIPESGTHTQI